MPPYRSLFLIKFQIERLRPYQKETAALMFSCKFCKKFCGQVMFIDEVQDNLSCVFQLALLNPQHGRL